MSVIYTEKFLLTFLIADGGMIKTKPSSSEVVGSGVVRGERALVQSTSPRTIQTPPRFGSAFRAQSGQRSCAGNFSHLVTGTVVCGVVRVV